MLCRFYRDNKIAMDILFRLVYSTVLTMLFFVTIAVTTTITAVKLRRVVQWRQRSTSSASVCVKEIALTKTLVATSVLLIVCLTPTIMVQIASFVEPEFYFTGRYYNLAFAVMNVMLFFRGSNSSFNFFIYYNISTRYRQTLRNIFRLCIRKRTESEEGETTETTRDNKWM